MGDGTGTANSFLPDNYNVSVGTGGFLKLAKGTNSETIAALTGSGKVQNIVGGVTSTLIVGNNDASGSFSGVLENPSGTLALTKTGTGTQTLAGTNTYTGATAVNAGTLSVTGSLAAGSAVAVASGATLSGSGTVGGTVTVATGTAVITAGDGTSGTLTLGALTFNGTGSVNIGTLSNYTSGAAISVTGTLTLSGSAITINLPGGTPNNGTYHLIGHGNTLANLTGLAVSGPAIGARQSGTLTNNTGMIDYVVAGDTPYWTGAGGGSWDTTTTSWKLITGGTDTQFIANDAVLFNDSATGTTDLTIASSVNPVSTEFNNSTKNYTVSGAAGITTGYLTKSGTGTLTINNANTFSGGTTINGGTLVMGDGGALGSGSIALNGGTLNVGNKTVTNSIVLGGGALASNGATLSGVVSETGGAKSLSVGNSLTLSNANTYSGGTTLTAGTLTLGNAGALGSGAVALNGGTLNVGGYTVSNNIVLGGGALAFNGATLSGVISETGGATSLSVGNSLTLNNANT